MPDYGHDLVFGAFVTPDARSYHQTVALAKVADSLRLDVLGVQDHPYQASFLDTWTFLSSLASSTSHVKLFPMWQPFRCGHPRSSREAQRHLTC